MLKTMHPYVLRIKQPWERGREGIYDSATKWIRENEDVCCFEKNGGTSWINGNRFYAIVSFKHEEDVLAFRLMFSEIL